MRKAKVLTPEEIEAKRVKSVAQHKEWRRNNPEKQQAIMERFWKKKVAAFNKGY